MPPETIKEDAAKAPTAADTKKKQDATTASATDAPKNDDTEADTVESESVVAEHYASCANTPAYPSGVKVPASQMGGAVRVLRTHVTFEGKGKTNIHLCELPHEAVLLRESYIEVQGDAEGVFRLADPDAAPFGSLNRRMNSALSEVEGLAIIQPLRAMAGIKKSSPQSVKLMAVVKATGPVTLFADLRYVLR